MPAKEPFHVQSKSQKNADKNKHEILLTSKSVDETKEKLKRASSNEKSAESKEFVVESNSDNKKLRVDLDSKKAPTMSTEGLLRASRPTER